VGVQGSLLLSLLTVRRQTKAKTVSTAREILRNCLLLLLLNVTQQNFIPVLSSVPSESFCSPSKCVTFPRQGVCDGFIWNLVGFQINVVAKVIKPTLSVGIPAGSHNPSWQSIAGLLQQRAFHLLGIYWHELSPSLYRRRIHQMVCSWCPSCSKTGGTFCTARRNATALPPLNEPIPASKSESAKATNLAHWHCRPSATSQPF